MQTLGPPSARVMIVGDFPNHYDVQKGHPFAGTAGEVLGKILHDAGMMLSGCFLTNLCYVTPPKGDISEFVDRKKLPTDKTFQQWCGVWAHPEVLEGTARLRTHIRLVKPTVVVCLGNAALRALAGVWGVGTWRGSVLQGREGDFTFKVIPTYAPFSVMQDWSLRMATVQDFRRVLRESGSGEVVVPKKQYVIRPNFQAAVSFLQDLLARLEGEEVRISCDLETRNGQIACIGYALSKVEAISIPLLCVERREGYWSAEQEEVIWTLVRQVHKHPNARIFGQNFLYDTQYFYRFFFLNTPIWFDTMVAQHCLLPGTPKSLDYLASIYCEHYVFWKDDGKEWRDGQGEDQLWSYNCDDCTYTYEIMEVLLPAVQAEPRLRAVWEWQQYKLLPLLFDAMGRGLRVNMEARAGLSDMLQQEIAARREWLHYVTGQELNIQSPKQMVAFFYNDCQFKPIKNRRTGGLTVDDKALETLAQREPAIRPLVKCIQELRSLSVFLATFVEAGLDIDGRMRSSFNPAGTETFRLSSGGDAFWTGMNLQNIPGGSSGEMDPSALRLPNLRKVFIPDPGMVMFDMDLDRADLQVVVWEADDEELRQALREGLDIHALNAKTLFNLSGSLEEVKRNHNDKRQLAKMWVHGTNYGGGATTMARTCGLTVHQAEKLRARWFEAHPGIHDWHKRQEDLLKRKRYAENKFGYRYTFLNRVEGALPEALAWVPQSTVACVINRAWWQIRQALPEVEILIQVHDSLVGQFPSHLQETYVPQILEAAKVVIPYDKPLVIPAGINLSTTSWGDCK